MHKGSHAILSCIGCTLMGVDGEGVHGRGSAREGGIDRARYRTTGMPHLLSQWGSTLPR